MSEVMSIKFARDIIVNKDEQMMMPILKVLATNK